MPTIQDIAPEIGFGTSGVRALVTQLTDRIVYAYTVAFLAYLRSSGQLGASGRVIVAHDLRPSSPAISRAAGAAIHDAGLQAEHAGAIATPALALRAMAAGAPGIMITGSHIPFDRNGIKFYTAQGEILKTDELGIRNTAIDLPEETFSEGRLIAVPTPPDIDPGAADAYARRYLDFFPEDLLTGRKIGVYQHSGVARDMLAALLHAFGADVLRLGRSDQFIPIDTEAVSATDQAQARTWCAEHALDAVVSTDGDADRPLIFDETGGMLRGDVIGILAALHLGAAGVAAPVSCNSALEKCGCFARVMRTRIGSPYVIEAMHTLAESAQPVVGFEANGGFLTGSAIRMGARHLAPLPTRDAILPMLAVFAMARDKALKLSQLPSMLPQRYTASDRLQGVATALSQTLVAHLSADDAARADFFSTQGIPVAVDTTDGLRVTLDNADIVHIRPSGNAPELRCYVESAAQAQADSLLGWGIARLHHEFSARQRSAAP
jgi:phosphomannomutase